MKTFFLAVTFLLLGADGAAQDVRRQAQPLRLTSEIVGQRYCAGDKLHILQMRLRLRYRNAGERKLIVYQGKNFFYQTRIRGGARTKPYEVVVLNSRFNDAQAEVVNAPRPGGVFVTLPPGGTHETEIVVGVGLAAEAAERGANSIAPGEHTLQVAASTWYESRKLAEELRARWAAAGLLWMDPVASEPLAFNAVREARTPPCR